MTNQKATIPNYIWILYTVGCLTVGFSLGIFGTGYFLDLTVAETIKVAAGCKP